MAILHSARTVNTCQIRVAVPRAALAQLQLELLVFPEVRKVMATDEPGVFLVVFDGERPDPQGWLRALDAAGFRADAPPPAAA